MEILYDYVENKLFLQILLQNTQSSDNDSIPNCAENNFEISSSNAQKIVRTVPNEELEFPEIVNKLL